MGSQDENGFENYRRSFCQPDRNTCRDVYTAPNWRFGALANNTWRDAPAAVAEQLGSKLSDFLGPALLVSGECNDWLGPLQKQHLSRLANADLVTIPVAGHDVVWDNPDATLAAIRRFLDR